MKYGETVTRWQLELNGRTHMMRLVHQFWTGEKKYYVDDELIKHTKGGVLPSASFGEDVTFTLGEHQGRFKFRAVGRMEFYDLYIDDEKIEGDEQRAMRIPAWAIVLLLVSLFLFGILTTQMAMPIENRFTF